MLLGLVVVPALVVEPAMVSANPGDCWLEISPATTTVGFNEAFAVNVTFHNPNATAITNIMCHINFTASLVEVTGVDRGATVGSPFTLDLAAPSWDNTTGWVDYDGACPLGTTTNVTSGVYATIHMKSQASSGTGTIQFVPVDEYGDPETAVIGTGAVDLTDWPSMVNGTVKAGAPVLTVNVAGSGTVKINNTIIPSSYPNTTSWSWNQVVPLYANATIGWAFASWTGTDNNAINPTTVNMTDDKSVTANFVPLPPQVGVNVPSPLDFIANQGGSNPPCKTFDVKNVGGSCLHWSVLPRPTWGQGDWWNWYNTYWDGANGTSVMNNVTMSVVNTTLDPNNYIAFVSYSPAANRTVNASGSLINGSMLNATVLVDKNSLDMVKQDANMLVQVGPNWYPANATVDFSYLGCHGWPYFVGQSWQVTVNQILYVMGTYKSNSTHVLYQVVTNYTNVTPLDGTVGPLGHYDYQVVTCLNASSPEMIALTTVKVEYWNDNARNFERTIDAATYVYPPPDVQFLVAQSPAAGVPPGPRPPDWATVSPTAGCLCGNTYFSGVNTATVCVNVGSLTEGLYTGNITVSGSSSVIIPITFTVKPATGITVERHLPGNALMANETYPGDTFDVTVTFTAPTSDLNSISLTDLAPDGWTVAVNKTECSPAANVAKAAGNKVEIGWFYHNATYTAKYHVTVPETATPGINEFPYDSPIAWLGYYFGENGSYLSNITGDYQMVVTQPGYVTGETRDVNANLLPDTLVTLMRSASSVGNDESTPLYSIECWNTGNDYWLRGTKDRYITLDTNWVANSSIHIGSPGWNPPYLQYIDWTTPEQLVAGNVTDFEGDFGLVPMACTFSYAMKSVNLWLFWPAAHSEWGLSGWKAEMSISSWQDPH